MDLHITCPPIEHGGIFEDRHMAGFVTTASPSSTLTYASGGDTDLVTVLTSPLAASLHDMPSGIKPPALTNGSPKADHLAPWMNVCISSGVSLPSLLASIALKILS
jgi:hypothetical protein